MKKVNFTAERVAGFKCEPDKQQSIFWDGKTPGLGLRVTAGGAKSYIFETRLHGKTLRMTIGDVRTWTVGKAQAEATDLKAMTDKGIDPRQQRQERQAAAEAERRMARRHVVTLADAWSEYLEYGKTKRNKRTGEIGWSAAHTRAHAEMTTPGGEKKKRGKEETKPGPLAALMSCRLSELTGEKLAEWLAQETKTRPTAAALSFRLLRAFAGWANDTPEYKDIIPADAFTTRKVRDTLPKPETKEGDCLQREQLKTWFEQVRKIGNPVISTYLQGLLLTGARRRELSALRWDDVDFQWRSLTIRDKVEGTRVIPLPSYLASLLLNLKRINETPPPKKIKKEEGAEDWKPSEWVFFSKTAANGRIQEPRYAHSDALKAAGLPHVSLHGLRRSFGTLAEWLETPAGITAQIMGHSESALAEKHYRRRPLDLLRMWHDKIEAWILEQAGITYAPAPAGLRVAIGN